MCPVAHKQNCGCVEACIKHRPLGTAGSRAISPVGHRELKPISLKVVFIAHFSSANVYTASSTQSIDLSHPTEVQESDMYNFLRQ